MAISSVKKVARQAATVGAEQGSKLALAAGTAAGKAASKTGAAVSDAFQAKKASASARKTPVKREDIKLGFLPNPGEKLGKKIFTIAAGKSLVFEAEGNQITNMGRLTGAGLVLKQDWISGPDSMGGKVRYRFTVTVPAKTKVGKRFSLESNPSYLARNDPSVAFKFKVVAG